MEDAGATDGSEWVVGVGFQFAQDDKELGFVAKFFRQDNFGDSDHGEKTDVLSRAWRLRRRARLRALLRCRRRLRDVDYLAIEMNVAIVAGARRIGDIAQEVDVLDG